MNLFIKESTRGIENKPLKEDDVSEITNIKNTTITADKEGIDIDISYEEVIYNNVFASQSLSKKEALKLANAIIDYYKDK